MNGSLVTAKSVYWVAKEKIETLLLASEMPVSKLRLRTVHLDANVQYAVVAGLLVLPYSYRTPTDSARSGRE